MARVPPGRTCVRPVGATQQSTSSRFGGHRRRLRRAARAPFSADGREPLPLLVICLGKRIIESWIHNNLKGGEVINLSETGYTNKRIAIA